MYAPRLTPGDTIGIIYPSQTLDEAKHARITDVLGRLGFRTKLGANAAPGADGCLASAEQRAEDLNAMVADDEVGMVLFGGGDGAVELLPLIDYDAITRRPTLFSSFSDATSILNAIHARTGLVTYYGAGLGQFRDLRWYDYMQFQSHFVSGREATAFVSDSHWVTAQGGRAGGRLIGGFDSLFAMLLANPYFSYDKDRDYLLFLEDHEYFNEVGAINTYLSFIEQSAFMERVVGLIFGHYSETTPPELLSRLERFGRQHAIPVVQTDDFGHGTKHAILPIGLDATLDADAQTLQFHG
ncbi:MAG: LD-carboxypeptidase [Propionibacteriaceae bacterium]|jgi:muramoyltetrapeptide carboxypeptidase|nr:LD-carboxypeptidase [Propionibacteriaceae bacterium]